MTELDNRKHYNYGNYYESGVQSACIMAQLINVTKSTVYDNLKRFCAVKNEIYFGLHRVREKAIVG